MQWARAGALCCSKPVRINDASYAWCNSASPPLFSKTTPASAPRSIWVAGCLLRHLPSKRGHLVLADRGALRAEARGDVVGNGRDLGVGVGAAEGRHGDDAWWSGSPRAGNHNLRNIRGTGIIHRARTGECGES